MPFKMSWVMVFAPLTLFGQPIMGPPQYREAANYVKDINQDGYKDSVRYFYDGGSGFGGTNMYLTHGKTHQTYEFSTFNTKWPILTSIAIHPDLYTKENEPFFDEVEKNLFPAIQVDKPELCLQWILDGFKSKMVNGNDSGLLEYAFGFQPRWKKGDIYLPKSYFVFLDTKDFGSTLQKTSIGDLPEWLDENTKGWLICYAPNIHGQKVEKVAVDNDLELYKAHKSVILKKQDGYMWVFVDEYLLTGGADKWGRVKNTTFHEGLIFVETEGEMAERYLFVVDHIKGICARFKYEYLHSGSDQWIQNGKLMLGDHQTPAMIDKIKTEIESLYKEIKL